MKKILLALMLAGPAMAIAQGKPVAAANSTVKEEAAMKEYFSKNHLKPQRTASGVYYVVRSEGTGNVIAKGQTAAIMYTGKFLDGKQFDSNVGRNPLMVNAGNRNVVVGMDDALLVMKKGGKYTIYIPSPLGYGAQDHGPIPGGSTMVFDMEITDVK